MRTFIIFLYVVYLVGSFQFTCTAETFKGLVVYFSFEEGSGKTVVDRSGNGNNGQLAGDTDWTDGKFGKALNFGGENGIVHVKHSDTFEFTDGITICAWIRPTLIEGPGEWQLIAAKGPDVDEFFEILLHPDGFIWMGWRLSVGRIVPEKSPPDIVKDKWQHIAVSFQADRWWTIYLNGNVLIDYPRARANLKPVESPLLLGTEEPFALNRYYNGDIDEFVIFNRGLSENDIKKLQAAPVETILAVDPSAKLSTTWGTLKQRYNVRDVSN